MGPRMREDTEGGVEGGSSGIAEIGVGLTGGLGGGRAVREPPLRDGL